MDGGKKYVHHEQGFTIVVATKRTHTVQRVLANYDRQCITPKELIIMVHGNMEIKEALEDMTRNRKDISIIFVSREESLGNCLNKGYEQARYPYIAKMDDDDYYSPYYLQEAYDLFVEQAYDIVCKQSIFYYLKATKEIIVHPRVLNYTRSTKGGAGATICMTKDAFKQLHYSDVKWAEDVDLFMRCREMPWIKVGSTTSYNFLCIRDADCQMHTWTASNEYLKERADKVFGSKYSTLEEAYSTITRYPVSIWQ